MVCRRVAQWRLGCWRGCSARYPDGHEDHVLEELLRLVVVAQLLLRVIDQLDPVLRVRSAGGDHREALRVALAAAVLLRLLVHRDVHLEAVREVGHQHDGDLVEGHDALHVHVADVAIGIGLAPGGRVFVSAVGAQCVGWRWTGVWA